MNKIAKAVSFANGIAPSRLSVYDSKFELATDYTDYADFKSVKSV
jgi:hypothetical protein